MLLAKASLTFKCRRHAVRPVSSVRPFRAIDHASLGEDHPDAAVEHASVEVDALVPRLEHLHVLVVDQILIGLVVFVNDVFPVGQVEEVVSFVDHRIEVVVRVAAVDHRAAEVILRVEHELVALLVLLVIVGVERIDELGIELNSPLRALDNVVPLVDRLVAVSVEEASEPLGGGIGGQILVGDVAGAEVELLEEGFALFGNGGQVKVSRILVLEDKLVDIAA